MISSGELTLKSGCKFTVEIHEVKIFQISSLMGGCFKMTENVKSQLEKDAVTAGSWQALQKMHIRFSRYNVNYDVDILVKDLFSNYPRFDVIKEYTL